MTNQSLCESCRHLREIVTGKGSRFLMCLLSQTDSRFRKYPPQPVRQCSGRQGEIEEVLLLEDSLLDYHANPFETDEKIRFDREQVQARVDAQVRTN